MRKAWPLRRPSVQWLLVKKIQVTKIGSKFGPDEFRINSLCMSFYNHITTVFLARRGSCFDKTVFYIGGERVGARNGRRGIDSLLPTHILATSTLTDSRDALHINAYEKRIP